MMFTMYPMDFEEYLWAKGKEFLADAIRNGLHNNINMVKYLWIEELIDNYRMRAGL